jgi:RNA polymerase sigma-70 factor (ECF subfamily)
MENRVATFTTTHWSVVLRAGGDLSTDAQAALETLCRTYWYPLYVHVRRRGWGAEDAQDLTQDFFARLLDKDYLNLAHRERGRFRTFLLTSLDHFLSNEWDKRRALKRGAAQTVPLVMTEDGEERYRHEPVDGWSPEKIYERRWATTLLEDVVQQLRHEYAAIHKEALFEGLKASVWGETPDDGYRDLAARLAMSEGALRVAAHRMRERYRALLRDAVAQTVDQPEDVEDELRHLVSVLRL